MKHFRLVDNILGWVAFLIAAFVYCSTIEPAASFWDCPEFITTGYKLEVGHPPGAPFFMLTANLFTHFASDASHVAVMVNTMSALLSAVCILFLFWTITNLSRKLLVKNIDEMTMTKLIAIEAAGLTGALIYTFTDTFWYSAVEGEVYGFSSAFTAAVFWLILKWDDHADEPHSDRWIVLIMYMTGLSIGVHLLNLLCVPALVLVFYYRKSKKPNLKGSILALLLSFVFVAIILYGIVPGIVKVGGWIELLFVNVLGCPFNTGLVVYIILLLGTIIWAIYESETDRSVMRGNISFTATVALLGIPFYGYGVIAAIIGIIVLAALWFVLKYKRGGKPLVSTRLKNTTLLCMLMLIMGYASYSVTVIRSMANTPMDQNSPEDIFTLGTYLSRDQYGDRPLFYGQAYTSQVKFYPDGRYCRPTVNKGEPVYQQKEKASEDEKDSYFIVRHKNKYVYAQNMLFPRMHDSSHAAAYENWMKGAPSWLPKKNEEPYNHCGETVFVRLPSQAENLFFFFSYQCNFMYWRYFMWNFAGRQNDVQGHGEFEHGNWITGIPFIDNARLGDQSLLPDELKQNKGHNVFYCLPLLLGLFGLFWQAFKERKETVTVDGKTTTKVEQTGIRQFWVVFFLFFMTGLAIVLYLNQTPLQPRERDYAYAGSFYAFAIWCGMGVTAIIDWLTRYIKRYHTLIAGVAGIICLLVPVQMASQTWDDHDRSNRYICRDFGQNYLMTLPDEGYPIIFSNGDNDTFPLWYNQDVEGLRTDARVCNLSYLQTDWYIDQMCRPAYDSPSVPITWPRLDYCSGTNEYVSVDTDVKAGLLEYYKEHPEEARKEFGDDPFEVKNILKYWVRSKDPNYHIIPSDTLYITIDKDAVRRSGMMMAQDSIPDKMVVSLKGKSTLYKSDLMILEILANTNWERPVYVAATVGAENYLNLGDNTIQEGVAYRITPFSTKAAGARSFDSERVYNNMMTRYKYGGLDKPGIYLDETNLRMCYTHRRLFAQLALNLIVDGEEDKAKKALEYAEKVIPAYNVPYNYNSGGADLARAYALLGMRDKSKEVVSCVFENSLQYFNWYVSLGRKAMAGYKQECLVHSYIMNACIDIASISDRDLAEEMSQRKDALMERYDEQGGTSPF